MQCRICESKNIIQIFENENCPKTSHKFLTEQELEKDKQVKVTVLKCNDCDTVQLAEAYSEEEYVSDYQRNITFSKSANAHMLAMTSKFASYGVKKVAEIGCGNGAFSILLKASTNNEANITAFEPSKAAYNTAKQNGLEVHNVFFDETLPKEFKGYDGFALRFVLEHLDSPNKILGEIKKRCLPGAVGLVEVPNAQKQFIENRWFDYFPEHILYFTPTTLSFTLERLGFEILWLESTMNNEFLSAFVRVAKQKVLETPEQTKEKFCKMVQGTTFLWGASGGATTFLSYISSDKECCKNIQYIVDSDVNKWGLFASGSKVKIVPPEEIQKNPPETVIIMALGYEKEIRKQLESMEYKGKIRSLSECLSEVTV